MQEDGLVLWVLLFSVSRNITQPVPVVVLSLRQLSLFTSNVRGCLLSMAVDRRRLAASANLPH